MFPPLRKKSSSSSAEQIGVKLIHILHFLRWQHLSDGCCWMTAARLRLNINENGGPRDHWRQIQIARNRNTAWVLHHGLCIGLGLWGDEESWGQGSWGWSHGGSDLGTSRGHCSVAYSCLPNIPVYGCLSMPNSFAIVVGSNLKT
jgi:hypothetical protein